MKIPFSPSVYEHAARWVERSPWDVSRDAELLFEGHRRAYQEYGHAPIVVGIDLYNLEAEAYGAEVTHPEGDGIPAINEPMFQTLEAALGLPGYDPARDGRIAMVIDVGKRLARELPEADVRIPVAGPFSIAINLRGITSLCEDLALQPLEVGTWLMELAENQAGFCQAVVDAGLDVAFFESAASPPMLSPRQFHEVELPALKRIIAVTEEKVGHPVPCIMGGDTILILDDLLSTGTGFLVCNVETDQRAFIARAGATHPQVKIRVNMDPGIVAGDSREAIHREIDRILEIAANHPNCLMGTGCLPLETPPENVRWIREYVS
ncbi:uroporphyrinogen decarboxylase family protein [Candidatus Latescibacterota bacterium]